MNPLGEHLLRGLRVTKPTLGTCRGNTCVGKWAFLRILRELPGFAGSSFLLLRCCGFVDVKWFHAICKEEYHGNADAVCKRGEDYRRYAAGGGGGAADGRKYPLACSEGDGSNLCQRQSCWSEACGRWCGTAHEGQCKHRHVEHVSRHRAGTREARCGRACRCGFRHGSLDGK